VLEAIYLNFNGFRVKINEGKTVNYQRKTLIAEIPSDVVSGSEITVCDKPE